MTHCCPSTTPMPVTMPARRRVVAVHVVGGERRELEKLGAGIDQPLDAFARGQLAALAVLCDGLGAAAAREPRSRRSRSSATKPFHSRGVRRSRRDPVRHRAPSVDAHRRLTLRAAVRRRPVAGELAARRSYTRNTMAAQTQVDVGGILRPRGQLDVATALAPYRGPLDDRRAAHLLRRAGFGGTPTRWRRYAGMPIARRGRIADPLPAHGWTATRPRTSTAATSVAATVRTPNACARWRRRTQALAQQSRKEVAVDRFDAAVVAQPDAARRPRRCKRR